MNFPYNSKYFPPAPEIEVRLGVPDESLKIGPLTAFVDSGADGTLVPARIVRSLLTTIYDRKFLRSQWGERRMVEIYRLDMGIGAIHLPAIEIVADTQSNDVIIGRNVLNKLRVLLNGPKQIVEISE